ncbi:MAG: DUF1178 family protein [Pseudomonadota bacterium]
MIRFSLQCDSEHSFDGWFASSDAFETQRKRGLVACPECNSTKVEKALMAPSVSTGRSKEKQQVAVVDAQRQAVLAEMRRLRDHITENAENVGEKFPDEARKMHYGETEERGIYGAASLHDVEELLDEGIEIAPLPVLPDDAN